MIDLHCITHPTQTRNIDHILSCTVPDIKINVVSGYLNHIGKGRVDGFKKGTNSLCSFVDDDDTIDFKVLQKCGQYMLLNPDIDMLVTNESVNGKVKPSKLNHLERYTLATCHYIHHFVLVKRSVIEKYYDVLANEHYVPEIVTWFNIIESGYNVVHYNEIGYNWCRNIETGAKNILKLNKESDYSRQVMHDIMKNV